MQPTTHVESYELDAAKLAGATHLDIGQFGEGLARKHLIERDHVTIVACNWRVTAGELRGELDCIARDDQHRQLVVVEVKCRVGAAQFGGAVAAYPRRKHAKVRRLAGLYLAAHPDVYNRVRIDVVAVDVAANRRDVELTHIVGVS